MKNAFYLLLAAFFLLVLESTFFKWASCYFFGFLGMDSLIGLCFDGAFIICIYIALTRSFNETMFMAFLLGYLKDIFILPVVWIDPLLFVMCAFASNILRNLFIVKGALSFSSYIFFISIFYSVLWIIVGLNVDGIKHPFVIGAVSMLPHATLNFIFAPFLFYILSVVDSKKDNRKFKGFLRGGIEV